MWDVITQPCPNFNRHLRRDINEWPTPFYENVIPYPCSNIDASLDHPWYYINEVLVEKGPHFDQRIYACSGRNSENFDK